MRSNRRLKILMTGGLAVLCGLVTAGNVNDPETNFQFVQHVLSMDTIQPSSALASHALPIPILWTAGFWLIVIGEGTTAVLFALGTFELFRARNLKARDFDQAKRFVFAAGLARS